MINKIKKIIKKKNKSKIVCLTAYSKNIAEIVDNHADIVLLNHRGWLKKSENTDKKLEFFVELTTSSWAFHFM